MKMILNIILRIVKRMRDERSVNVRFGLHNGVRPELPCTYQREKAYDSQRPNHPISARLTDREMLLKLETGFNACDFNIGFGIAGVEK